MISSISHIFTHFKTQTFHSENPDINLDPSRPISHAQYKPTTEYGMGSSQYLYHDQYTDHSYSPGDIRGGYRGSRRGGFSRGRG